MNNIIIPEHDINKLFDELYNVLKVGDCSDKAPLELKFLNSMFAALPGEAIEHFMRFLCDGKRPGSSCEEILPLFIRLKNLVTYCDKLIELRNLPVSADIAVIMKRSSLNEELDNLEEPFGKKLLGYSMGDTIRENLSSPAASSAPTNTASANQDEKAPNNGSGLLLMNGSAVIFPCPDIYKTSLFYEKKLGFSAVFLDDEAMPHIRLTRDNIIINLVQIKEELINNFKPSREAYGIDNDAYIYASEPLLLLNELKSNNITIVKELEDSKVSVNSGINREFVMEDCDGRHICISQCANIDELLGFV
ncbi:MAG: hypothetical protein MJ172_03980 [Clostridia bacterium]|nr:hypothetical protein [Clostridia bacterium]